MQNTRNVSSYEKLEGVEYFIPASLPPKDPPFNFNNKIIEIYGEAMYELGQLNEIAERLPNLTCFIKAHTIKEGLFSSAIEGIHTNLIDVLKSPLTNIIDKETEFILNYILASYTALNLIYKEQGISTVSKALRRAHKILMKNNEYYNDNYYENQRIHIKNLLPLQTVKILDLISDLKKFINNDNSLPLLIKIGLVYAQFEAINPFIDKSGCTGRLLIILMLIDSGLLKAPILCPSYYFNKKRLIYYYRFNQTRISGNFEEWIYFYLQVIKDSCNDARRRILEIEALEKKFQQIILTEKFFSNIQKPSLEALSIFFEFPIINITELSKKINKSYNTADSIITHFLTYNILEEIGMQKRKKLYRFTAYIKLLEKDY